MGGIQGALHKALTFAAVGVLAVRGRRGEQQSDDAQHHSAVVLINKAEWLGSRLGRVGKICCESRRCAASTAVRTKTERTIAG